MCPNCGGQERRAFVARDVNRRVSADAFVYNRCRACKLVRLTNPPADLARYYPPDYYGALDEADLRAQRWRVECQLAPSLRRPRRGTIIEIGAHSGALLVAAEDAGFTGRIAIERDLRAGDHMRSLGIDVVTTDDPVAGLAGAPQADAVHMHHVLEHVPDPLSLLDAAARQLKPGGHLVLATPNPQAISFLVCRGLWMHVDAPRHLHLLPYAVVRDRLADRGLVPQSLTSRDAVSEHWNEPSWAAWLDAVAAKAGRVGYWAGRSAMRLGTAVETRPLRGSCYMATFTMSS